MKPTLKWVAKVLERPFAVKTPKGEWLCFADKQEALAVSRCLSAVYYVFLTSTRSWVPVGINFPKE